MIQDDYLKKQIDELGLVLAGLLGKLMGKGHMLNKDDITVNENTLVSKLDINIDEFTNKAPKEWANYFINERKLSNSNLLKLADIMYYLSVNNEAKKNNYLEKSLALYLHLEKAEPLHAFEVLLRIDRIKEEIE